jgi:hypothetical protein
MRRPARRLPPSTAALLVGALAVGLSLPPMRSLIEQSMVWHMVIQMPLLVLSGCLSMGTVSGPSGMDRWAYWNRYGLSGFIAALIVMAYWMLPLTIDRAVVLPTADAMKVASLGFAGAVLRHSFQRAPAVLQMFFMGTAVPMATWLGLYFASTELRLCNAYSLQSQMQAGWGLAALAATFGTVWLLGLVRSAPRSKPLRNA